jgi:hypothetical protein
LPLIVLYLSYISSQNNFFCLKTFLALNLYALKFSRILFVRLRLCPRFN